MSVQFATTWTDEPEVIPPGVADDAQETPAQPQFLSVADLCAGNPAMRPPIIEGLLRQGETMNVIAPPKAGKSWLVLDLAIATALGRCWLDTFPTVGGPVLLIDNELHKNTLANRIPAVASARGVTMSELAERLYVESFRGRLQDFGRLAGYFAAIEPGKFKLIICDAFYRFLPPGVDENSNSDLAGIYNLIDRYADQTKAAFVLIHHASKGVQANKGITDVGAGAGSQARASDSHLILRQHEEDGAVVLEAAVRSWQPVKPICLRWSWPIWTPAPDLDPEQLRQERRRKRKDEPGTPGTETPKPWDVDRFVREFVTQSAKDKRTIMASASVIGDLSNRMAENFLTLAESSGKVFRWTFQKDRGVYFSTRQQMVTDTVRGQA